MPHDVVRPPGATGQPLTNKLYFTRDREPLTGIWNTFRAAAFSWPAHSDSGATYRYAGIEDVLDCGCRIESFGVFAARMREKKGGL
ncbi:hypothetical protein [Streptomyces sp. NPDC050560]|uniref:hypothetical protein n=1 Tax=Streptomyces sp. NPDC050560 TaxID=3365630 RepID=UPI0037A7D798